VTDGAAAWVGSDSGNVKRIELQSDQVTGGSTKCWLEHTHTLRHQAKRRRSSTVFSSTASAELDDLSRVDSARASEDYTAGEEQPAVGIVGVRAHAGPVTAVEAHQNLVFTSGGSPSHPALHQWAHNGVLQHSHKLTDLGTCSAGLLFLGATAVWSAAPGINHPPPPSTTPTSNCCCTSTYCTCMHISSVQPHQCCSPSMPCSPCLTCIDMMHMQSSRGQSKICLQQQR